ncbi:hypothetical protein ACFUCT_23860 [Streptomyces parvus]|uniref:hypothetical protein n=1 Tax=Streptomyces parvus TaxID=66428 RepID=UPI0036303733
MPIRPENLHRYPRDWPQISARIRFERAGGRCECTGHCGLTHPGGRCPAVHEEIHPDTGSVVGLTTAHLNHTPEDVREINLLAACQLCHLRIDHGHHRVTFRWFWDPDVQDVEREPFPHHALGGNGQTWLCNQEACS